MTVWTMPGSLDRALAIAKAAHMGQVDKVGAPYISHPMRVCAALDSVEEKIVGLLHDVVEDGPGWTFDRLRREGFSESVVAAVEALTHRPDESYSASIDRAKANPLARVVKLADLADNSDRTRLTQIGEREEKRLAKYADAIRRLAF
jgi:(p)ppGpp synthase/HD superfamily hydrolase